MILLCSVIKFYTQQLHVSYIMGHTVLEDSVVQYTECHAEPDHSDCSEDNTLCSDPYLSITKHKSILNTIYTT